MPKREKILFKDNYLHLVYFQLRDRSGVGGHDPAGGANASGRDHAGLPYSYWRPGKGAVFPVVAALRRRVTLGARLVT